MRISKPHGYFSPQHLFVTSGEGHLFDTRIPDWHKHPPLRPAYSYTFHEIKTLAQVKATIRNGAFAWPGGYPLYFITQDGAALCFDCAHKEFRQVAWDYLNKASTGWRIVGCEINYVNNEDGELICDHCNKRIESGYAEERKK